MNNTEAIKAATKRITDHLSCFSDGFPAEQSCDHVYPRVGNISWTGGFYTGILWLCYELTKQDCFLDAARWHDDSLRTRLITRDGVDHHDLGFLYTLSAVAEFKLTGSDSAKETALLAADCLLERFQKKGGFLQAWGPMNDPESYRLIIDCLMNIPLLFWAGKETGNKKYDMAARTHLHTTMRVIARGDGSTYHTFFFDPDTGAPLRGITHQGYSDDSCWARGQAWGVYGLALSYRYTKDETILPLYCRVTDYFLNHLPKDAICYWDLVFSDGSGQPRDTSAAAIAVCGMMEMEQHQHLDGYQEAAKTILASLRDHWTTQNLPQSNGLLTDGMYNRNNGDQPECNIWGDYFYLEALMRSENPHWRLYW